jgi:site-specific recombinase XerC
VVRQLQDWCLAEKRRVFIETVDDRLASDFRDLGLKGVHTRTVNKKLSALRQYWNWLGKRFGIKSNPWNDKSLPKPKAHLADPDGPDAQERAFTDDEVRKLLAGDVAPLA